MFFHQFASFEIERREVGSDGAYVAIIQRDGLYYVVLGNVTTPFYIVLGRRDSRFGNGYKNINYLKRYNKWWNAGL